MNKAITSAILATGLIAAAAGSAQAASSAYCTRVAQQTVDRYTHPVGNTLLGCAAGGVLGNILSGGKAGATAGGCAAGGAGAFVLSDVQRKKVYDQAYWNCMGSGGPPPPAYRPQPVVAGPPPSAFASVYVSLNVRSGPSTGYPVVFTLSANTTVPVHQCTPSWCQVGDANQIGWASRKYLFFQ